MSDVNAWYVIREANGQCTLIPANQIDEQQPSDQTQAIERWGPYDSQQDAIARRVGLIRAGKCLPA
ncbi:MAG: hypothetical protein RBJ76_19990 [Stenomitos frigidus ULC029]